MTLLRILFRGMVAVCLLAIGVPHLGAQNGNSFAGWPQTWVDAYQRFESYNAARKKYFPAADLEISPEGKIFHTVQLFRATAEHLSMVTYKNGYGGRSAGLDTEHPLFANNRTEFYPPGTYAAALMSCGMAGYQLLYPLIWFETKYSEGRSSKLVVRMTEPPADPDAVWPNERLLKFLDFHIFPHHHPDDVLEKNAKVTPDIVLRLTNAGVIERDKLDPALEKLLRWRIYHNGRILEEGPAGRVTRFNAARGPGTYQAFVGVEGPAGFMPVSNMLEFPLFPEKDGTMAVFPSVTNIEGFPDFLFEMITSDQLANLLAAPHGGEQIKSPYNKRSVSLSGFYDDPKKQELLSLWQSWSYQLYRETDNLKSVLGRPPAKSMPTPAIKSP